MAGKPSPLAAYMGVQQATDREMARALELAAKQIRARIVKLNGLGGVGANVRAAQLQLTLNEIRQVQRTLWRGGIIQAIVRGQKAAAEAAVAAQETLERVLYGKLPERVADAVRDSLRHSAHAGIDSAYSRVPRTLSARVYNAFTLSSGRLERTIRAGIISGLSARELAAEVYSFVSPTAPGGASYAAMRLARTEINNAFHQQQIAGGQRPGVKAIKWNLSGSHKVPDDCNKFAAHASRFGAGCYDPGRVPDKPHPQCLCYLTYVTMSPTDFVQAIRDGDFDSQLDAKIKERLALLSRR